MLAFCRDLRVAHVVKRFGSYSRVPSDDDAEETGHPTVDLLAGTHRVEDVLHDSRAFRKRCWARYLKGEFTVQPEGNRYLLSWDLVVIISLVTTAIAMPVEAAFFTETPLWLWRLCLFMDVVFFWDTVLTFNVAFMVPTAQGNDSYERRPAYIARRYVSVPFSENFTAGWFWPDFMSILPWDLTIQGDGTRRFVRTFRLVRMFRLPRLSKLFDRWQKALGVSYATANVMAVFGCTFMLLHWVSCFWGWMVLEFPDVPNWLSGYVERQSEEIQGELGHDVFLPIGVYNMALYFCSMQLTGVGFGDIYPVGQTEVLLSTVTMFLMGFMWAFVIGSIINAITSFDTVKSNFQQFNDDMGLLLKKRGLAASLRKRVRGYLQQSFKVHMHEKNKETLAMLSLGLQGEIATQAGMKQICDCVWYLKGLSQIELVEVAAMFKADLYTPNELIMRTDAVSVIVRGICSRAGRILTKHDCIGEDMLLTNTQWRCRDHPRTLSFVETMVLSRAHLADVCARFPDLSRRMRRNQIKLAMRRAVVHINKNVKEKLREEEEAPRFDFPSLEEHQKSASLTRPIYEELFKPQADQRFLQSDDLQPLMISLLRMLQNRLSPRAHYENSDAAQATNEHGQNVAAQAGRPGNFRFEFEALAASQRRVEAQLENLVSKLDGLTALPAQQLQQEQQQQHLSPQQPSLHVRQPVVGSQQPTVGSKEDDAANEIEGQLGVLQTQVEQAFARLEAVMSHTSMDLISESERSWNNDEEAVALESERCRTSAQIKPVHLVDPRCGRLYPTVLENHRTVAPHGATTMQASSREIISRQADAFEASMVLQLRRLVDDCVDKATTAPRA